MSVIIKLLSKFDDSGLRKAKSGFSGLTKSLSAVGVGYGIKQLGDGLMEAITLASNLSEQTAAVGQVFGAGATAIEKFANGAATNLGQTKTQVMEAAKTFGVFGKAAGLTEKGNAKFSTSLISLATDMASFNNTSVDDAINALSSGLRGEAEPLRRYGVLLNDATLKDEALRLGLIKTTKEALTPQQKVLAANSAIFKQTTIQQGDFARTSGGLANQQRILTASFEDAKTTLGTSLLPMFTTFVTYINENVVPAVQQFVKDISDPKTDAGKMFTDIKDAVQKAFKDVQDFFALFGDGNAMAGFSNVVSSLVSALPALLALKGIMVLANSGKAIANLIAAMTAIAGKSAVPNVPPVAGAVNPLTAIAVGSQIGTYVAASAAQNTVTEPLKAKGLQVNLVASTFTGTMAIPTQTTPKVKGDLLGLKSSPNWLNDLANPKPKTPTPYVYPTITKPLTQAQLKQFSTDFDVRRTAWRNANMPNGVKTTPAVTNNITINVPNADPKAVVNSFAKYTKQNGTVPSFLVPPKKPAN